MTTSAKEVIARALYELDPAEDQETDLDGRPVGKPYTIAWDQIAEYEAPAVNSFREDATAILAALEAAGYVVVERFVIDALVAALEKAKDWMISCDAPTWGRMEIEEADAALALARKEG